MASKIAFAAAAAVLVLLLGACGAQASRELLQSPSPSPSPSSYTLSGVPTYCQDTVFSGNQWSGDEIECHVCDDNEYQLSCELDTDVVTEYEIIKCEFDSAGAESVTTNAVDFRCDVIRSASPVNECDWEYLEERLPSCGYTPTREILSSAWL